MEQFIIDRYNKGQQEYKAKFYPASLKIKIRGQNFNMVFFIDTSIYDFLFNPRWKFAKTVFGEKETYDEYHPEDDETVTYINKYGWQHYIQQMAIAPDVLKYLEQFKEA